MNETFVVDNIQGSAFVADVAENVRPMNKNADSPDEIKSLFDTVAYQKGKTFEKNYQPYIEGIPIRY